MKSIFSIRSIFSFFFCVAFLFSSCSKYLIVNGSEKVPKKVVVRITGYDSISGKLTMVDDFGHSLDTFNAWASQKINWEIEVSGLQIDGIAAKNNNWHATDSIFKNPPHKGFLTSTWKGVVQDETFLQAYGILSNGVTNFDYNIVWQKTDTTKHTFDPRIQIR